MNRIYRTIWSRRLGGWVAVSERARGSGKAGGRSALVVAGVLLLGGLLTAGTAVAQLPTGGAVTGGSASIMQNSATSMTILQSSVRAAINWQSFSIGAGKTVEFKQPDSSAVALNRVTGPDPSTIQGALRANGQVFLINPSGVLFSPTAQVSVGGLQGWLGLVPSLCSVRKVHRHDAGMCVGRAHKKQALLACGHDIVGVLACAFEQLLVFQALDSLPAAEPCC